LTPPKVSVLSLGGTIAMASEGGSGVVPTLTGDDLISAVPQLGDVGEVTAYSFRQVPGAHLRIEDLAQTAAEIARLTGEGSDGIVITQGTDTIEETAFVLDLLADTEAPLVVTGAMRNPTLPGADGPANLLASVQVAASSAARGLGALVVFNDEIHAARHVRKIRTQNPAAFSSFPVGPVGWVAEGKSRIALRVPRTPGLQIPEVASAKAVALVTVALGDDGSLLYAVERSGYAGLVVEAMGGGHVPAVMVEALASLADKMPVILASRTGGGEILRHTYGFPGSEIDLLDRGLIPAGPLDGPKARLLLTLLLMSEIAGEDIPTAFDRWITAIFAYNNDQYC
jgi:L-asparaginase